MTKKQEIEELKDELKMQGQRKDQDARLIEFLNDKIDKLKEDIFERDILRPIIEQESRDLRKRLEFAEAFINEGCMSELYDFVLEAQAKEHE